MIYKSLIPTSDQMSDEFLSLIDPDVTVHNNIVLATQRINNLYNKSSVTEDIVLSRFLSTYCLAKAITPYRFVNKNIIIESFLSQELVDASFPIDYSLNMDLQNGDLTLPIATTDVLSAKSVIIESESNGELGDSTDGSNNDISVILSSSSSSLFKYEKISNALSLSNLCLSLTIKLDEESISNGVYIRMYAANETKYPSIESIAVSLDGVDWSDVQGTIDVNKADYYIRFTPQKIRYVKVKFKQDSFSVIPTSFGSQYRYSIGIREITARRTEYLESGEYVSNAFESGKRISSVTFSATDVSGENIKYFISSNNGGRWTPITSGETITLNTVDTGISDGIEVGTVRVKIEMTKTDSVNKTSMREYILSSSNNKYFLKHTPIDIEAYACGHISYGPSRPYRADFVNARIDPDIYEDQKIRIPIYYLPYQNLLNASGVPDKSKLVVHLNGSLLKESLYEIEESLYQEHCILAFQSGLDIPDGILTIYLTPYIGVAEDEDNIFKLPMKAMVKSQKSMRIETLNASGVVTGVLDPEDFLIIPGEDYDSVEVLEHTFSPFLTYRISYSPLAKINESIEFTKNQASMPALQKMPFNTQICFEYTYKTVEDATLIPYFTSICNEYKLEIL